MPWPVKKGEIMDVKEYEKILNTVPTTGVFIVREDNHEILYFNRRVAEVAPHVHTGMPCHELGNHSCANCPLLTIGDKQENQTISYNNPFGETVDILAVRTMWEQETPAFIITVAPHMQAINHAYHKILRVNLTEDSYEEVKIRAQDRAYGYGADTFSGWLGRFIYNGGIHPEDMNSFIAFTRLENMKTVFDGDHEILSCCYRRYCGEEYRWNLMEIVPDISSGEQGKYIFIYPKIPVKL